MSHKRKRSIIIGTLCGVLLLMVVGYAAFSSVLNIKGTSSISSNWNIKITNIESKNATSGATEKEAPTGEGTLSATFNVDLKSPGDSIEYEITVTNGGNIDAKLNEINLTDTNNPAIKFTVSMVKDGVEITDMEQMKTMPLNTGENCIFKIKIEFLTGVVIDDKNLSSKLTVTLDYNQNDGGGTVPGPAPEGTISMKGVYVPVVEEGSEQDGLYLDTYGTVSEDTNINARYVYKGANPDNYITFNNELWRIISMETDGTLKIMKKDKVTQNAWDNTNSNDWARPASLNTYLNEDYYNSLDSNSRNLIQNHAWGIGPVTFNMTHGSYLENQIASENSVTWTGNIGLMSVSDVIRANPDIKNCKNLGYHNANYKICKNTNYILLVDYSKCTINPYRDNSDGVIRFSGEGDATNFQANLNGYPVYPALYLKSDITLSGSGTETDPFTIQ